MSVDVFPHELTSHDALQTFSSKPFRKKCGNFQALTFCGSKIRRWDKLAKELDEDGDDTRKEWMSK